jgi:hypothetical protein
MKPSSLASWSSESRRDKWALERGLKLYARSAPCIFRLLDRVPPGHRHRGGLCWPPGSDHASLWTHAGKPSCFISQPYSLDSRVLDEMLDFAMSYQLRFVVSTWPAFYYPGHVLMVEWFRYEWRES